MLPNTFLLASWDGDEQRRIEYYFESVPPQPGMLRDRVALHLEENALKYILLAP